MAERSVAIATANAQLGPAQVAALAKAEWERMHPDDQLPWAEQERLLQEKYAKVKNYIPLSNELFNSYTARSFQGHGSLPRAYAQISGCC